MGTVELGSVKINRLADFPEVAVLEPIFRFSDHRGEMGRIKRPAIKPLAELIAELEEEVRRLEKWRKAQGIAKGAPRLSLPLITKLFGKEKHDED